MNTPIDKERAAVAPQQPDILVPWSVIEETCLRIMKESDGLTADSQDYRLGIWGGADKVMFALDCAAERIRLTRSSDEPRVVEPTVPAACTLAKYKSTGEARPPRRTMSDSPSTDALIEHYRDQWPWGREACTRIAHHARQLERELAEEKKISDDLRHAAVALHVGVTTLEARSAIGAISDTDRNLIESLSNWLETRSEFPAWQRVMGERETGLMKEYASRLRPIGAAPSSVARSEGAKS